MSAEGASAADATPLTRLAQAVRALQANVGRPSARSIAKGTGISHTTASEVLSGRRLVSWDAVRRVGLHLGADEKQLEYLWEQAAADNLSNVRRAESPIESMLPSYRTRLLQLYSKVGIRGAIPGEGALTFNDGFVAPTFRRISSELDSHEEDISFRAFSETAKRAVLLGAPGSGKTSVAIALVRHFAQPETGPTPFYIMLREFASESPPERSVLGYISHQLRVVFQLDLPPGFVDNLLLNGSTYVIFDGLDEIVSRVDRERVARIIELFGNSYPEAGILVTSRVVGYAQAPIEDSDFNTFELKELSEAQVLDFASRRFTGHGPDVEERVQEFMRDSEQFRDLRSNPMLLDLVSAQYLHHGILPRDRTHLYQSLLDFSLSTWDSMRRVGTERESRSKSFRLLQFLAYEMMKRDSLQLSQDEVERISAQEFRDSGMVEDIDEARLAAAETISWLRARSGILVDLGPSETGRATIGIFHRSFAEYLAAAHVVRRLTAPSDLAQELYDRLGDGKWSEVARMAIEISDDVREAGAMDVLQEIGNRALKSDDSEKIRLSRDLLEEVSMSRSLPGRRRNELAHDLRVGST